MLRSSGASEGDKFLENGHKFMKTSLLKWSPDHDNAANQYQQAALAYKSAGLHEKAIAANELAIKCYLATQSAGYHAAKCMEQAALSSRELGDVQGARRYFSRAVEMSKSIGQLDSAISTVDRAAKALVDKAPKLAAEFHVQASEICAVEDRYRQAAEHCNRAAVLYLKEKEYGRAANMFKEELNCYLQVGETRNSGRLLVTTILVHLAGDNWIAANEVFRAYQIDEDELYHLANNLITGFDKNDTKLVHSTLTNSFFKNLDTEVAKLARHLLETKGKIDTSTKAESPVNEEEMLL